MTAITQPVESVAVQQAVGGAASTTGALRAAVRLRRTQIGLALFAVVMLIAFVGPFFAPDSSTEIIGAPFSAPSKHAILGSDILGRDVLSRLLFGGRSVIEIAFTATVFGVGLGALIGVSTAYLGSWFDLVVMRGVDTFLALPETIFILMILTALGSHVSLVIITVAISHAARTARVIRAASLNVVTRDFVAYAHSLGEKTSRIIVKEMMPNISTPLLVEFGLRLTFSIGAVAGLSFLGFGVQAPVADWGVMANENRLGLVQQPWSIAAPVALIAVLTISVNLMCDGLSSAAIGRAGTRNT